MWKIKKYFSELLDSPFESIESSIENEKKAWFSEKAILLNSSLWNCQAK